MHPPTDATRYHSPHRVGEEEADPFSRKLPAVPLPLAGESLLSWLDHMALEWGVPRGNVAEMVGLLPESGRQRDLLPTGRLMFGVSGGTAARASAATGLTSAEVEGLTLSRQWGVSVGLSPLALGLLQAAAVTSPDRTAVSFDRVTLVELSSRDEWVHPDSVNICPHCLAEGWGRWPMSWYLPWAFLCPRHRCYLISHCPGCGGRFEPFRPGFGKGLCSRPVTLNGQPQRGRYCDVEIDRLSTLPVRDEDLIALQRRLLALLDPGEEGRPDAYQTFCDLWAMAFLVIHTASPDLLGRADPPVRARFRELCSAFDAPGHSTKQKISNAQDIRDPLQFAALFRVAALVVFADDPHRVALALGLLRSRSTASRQAAWPYPRSAAARSAAGPRLSRVMKAVVSPKEFAADQALRAEVGLATAPGWTPGIEQRDRR